MPRPLQQDAAMLFPSPLISCLSSGLRTLDGRESCSALKPSDLGGSFEAGQSHSLELNGPGLTVSKVRPQGIPALAARCSKRTGPRSIQENWGWNAPTTRNSSEREGCPTKEPSLLACDSNKDRESPSFEASGQSCGKRGSGHCNWLPSGAHRTEIEGRDSKRQAVPPQPGSQVGPLGPIKWHRKIR